MISLYNMLDLEKIVKNFGKGSTTGLAKAVDPLGYILSSTDRWHTGAGYSSSRSPKTLHNKVYQSVYGEDLQGEQLDLAQEYVPRGVGNVAGIGVGALGLYGLYSYLGPVAALAIPVVTGVYDLAKFVARYVHDFTRGERVYEDTYEKSSFYEGLRLGWHKTTYFGLPLLHELEGEVSGRGFNESKIESYIKESSTATRRNFASIAGSIVGGALGAIASLGTLFILPVYKTIREVVNQSEGKRMGECEPSFRFQDDNEMKLYNFAYT